MIHDQRVGARCQARVVRRCRALRVECIAHRFRIDLNAGYTLRGGSGVQAPRDGWLWTASCGGVLAGRLS